MIDIFKDIVHSILVTKENVIKDEIDLAEYKPFVVNRALSAHKDCIFYVSELNNRPNLDPDIQYHYYLHSIKGMKRKFQPWNKKDKIEDIEAVRKCYGYSYPKALEAIKILSEDDLIEIRESMDIGGVKK